MKKGRNIKLFNGRLFLKDGRQGHGYIGAYSAEDAIRVHHEYCGGRGSRTEIKVYWSHGCWGTSMEGITPERGLWITEDRIRSKPKRVL